jgi:hypothetical protein
MSQEPADIKAHIKAEGESLRENIEEIENRVKEAFDMRRWYRNNTGLALGGAVAGGLLIALMLGRGDSKDARYAGMEDIDDEPLAEANGRQRLLSEPKSASRLHQLLDNTMSAVVGVAADKFHEFMSNALPGFREHYTEAQSKKRFE